MHWFIDPIKNQYADFNGRTTRQEFWMFVLVYLGVSIGVAIVANIINMSVLSNLFSLALLAPTLAIGARRLHDVNKSGWWQLILLIPIVGIIILIVWWAGKAKNENNQYGTSVVSETSDTTNSEVEATAPVASEKEASVENENENTKQGFGQ